MKISLSVALSLTIHQVLLFKILTINNVSIKRAIINNVIIIISTYCLKINVIIVIKIPATKFPIISGKKLCLKERFKNTAIAVPVQTPVTGKGIATNIKRPIVSIFNFTSSALPSVFLAKSSALFLRTASTFKIKFLTKPTFLSKLNSGFSKKKIGIHIKDEPI